jgi:hypothetical protein
MKRVYVLLIGISIASGVAGTAASVSVRPHHRAAPAAHARQARTCLASSATRVLASAGVTTGELGGRQTRGSGRTGRWSYDWPVRPFDRQHPVRAFFDDPRVGWNIRAFHFGIDISAPDGAGVYAIESGEVYLNNQRSIGIAEPSGRVLSYWHVIPAVPDRSYVTRHQLIGHVARGWEHVHLAERVNGRYLNPLRPGGIGPYRDSAAPTIDELGFVPGRAGTVDAVVSAFDMPTPRVPGRWADEPVTPALLRWRLVRDGRAVIPWRTAADFSTLLPRSRYAHVYAPGTRQNHPASPGRYCFYLRTGWQVADLPAGTYALQVVAADTRGNSDLATLPLRVS